eukprot:1155215-Pelagomonas_calceolata.AAC.2
MACLNKALPWQQQSKIRGHLLATLFPTSWTHVVRLWQDQSSTMHQLTWHHLGGDEQSPVVLPQCLNTCREVPTDPAVLTQSLSSCKEVSAYHAALTWGSSGCHKVPTDPAVLTRRVSAAANEFLLTTLCLSEAWVVAMKSPLTLLSPSSSTEALAYLAMFAQSLSSCNSNGAAACAHIHPWHAGKAGALLQCLRHQICSQGRHHKNKKKEKSTPAKRPRAFRKGSLTTKITSQGTGASIAPGLTNTCASKAGGQGLGWYLCFTASQQGLSWGIGSQTKKLAVEVKEGVGGGAKPFGWDRQRFKGHS